MVAERRDLSSLGPLSLVLQQQETLEDALRMLIRYQHLLSDEVFRRSFALAQLQNATLRRALAATWSASDAFVALSV